MISLQTDSVISEREQTDHLTRRAEGNSNSIAVIAEG